MSLHIGPTSFEIPANCQVDAEGQNDFLVINYSLGDPVDILAKSSDRFVRFVTRQDTDVTFDIPENSFLSVNIVPIPSDVDPIDPVPVEVPDENKPQMSLEDKLKVYLAEMVAERYGQDSAQYDTFEEAMDLDWEEDDEAPLSGFEVSDMTEEILDESGEKSIKKGGDKSGTSSEDEKNKVDAKGGKEKPKSPEAGEKDGGKEDKKD